MGGGRGRGKRSRTQRKHFRDGRENVWKRPKFDSSSDPNNTTTNNPTWQPFATQNQAFDEYYKEQGIVAREEWDTFVQVLRTSLPAAFRINSSSQFCTVIRSQLEDGFVKSLKAEVTDGGEVEAIRPLPWYLDNLAWHSNFSRMQLRKNQALERFHEFLKLENEIGNITRQEAVSMVPPLFLDVRPHHFVLDTQHFPGCRANKNFIKVSEIELEAPVSKLILIVSYVMFPAVEMVPFARLLICGGNERCMRIVPHDQNSGAFFIAILHKLSSLPVIQEKPSERGNMLTKKYEEQEKLSEQVTECNNGVELNSEDAASEKFSEAAAEADLVENETDKAALDTDPCNIGDENDSEKNQILVDDGIPSAKAVGKRKLQIQGKWKGVDPVILFKDEATINSIKEFYGIDESFPFSGHLISRNSDTNHVKRIYYISKSVKDILELNLLVGQQLKISSVGLKMFEQQTSRVGTTAPCAFRISSEGLPVILSHITKQILYASTVDFKHLLQYKAVKFKDFVDAEFGEKASKLMLGCSVVVLRDTKTLAEPIQVDASTIAIGCWKGRASLSVMVTAIDCQELLERLSARMEIEKDSSVQKHNVEANEVQDMNGIEKVEESETTKEATNG
ncbi:hypothetical protein P3X46_018498 [Hevea brasiliensis]|uniref:Uncharacterized protein n=1 Tax=Hevea brasiliensis TaxID=3981 RepID=A0ABQ9LQX1_HEVBR|nr:hypothetical protein P3X46_018498 [Hevea brasiliensis]